MAVVVEVPMRVVVEEVPMGVVVEVPMGVVVEEVPMGVVVEVVPVMEVTPRVVFLLL